MRRIGPLFLVLALCILASLATPSASFSVIPLQWCGYQGCAVHQDCDAFCQANCGVYGYPKGYCYDERQVGWGYCLCDTP